MPDAVFRYHKIFLVLTLFFIVWIWVGSYERTVEKNITEKGKFSIKAEKKRDDKNMKIENSQNANHALPGTYNLMEDAAPHNGGMRRPTKHCTLEYMNNERLQQDHPCVVNNIKDRFLEPPAPRSEPYQLDYPEVIDPSDGQSRTVLHLLKNKTNGFFVECGALDGENISNTLYMERYLNWTGVLIEADRESFKYLRSRKRKSWSIPVCLSTVPYPQTVTFRVSYAIGHIVDDREPVKNLSGRTSSYGQNVETQCFPLYSILLALGRKDIDYFSLDVEGYEAYILKTIPFDMLNIAVLSVEWITARSIEDRPRLRKEIANHMMTQGYIPFHSRIYGADIFFVKKGHSALKELYEDDPIIMQYEPDKYF